MRTTKCHHSSFLYAIKSDFISTALLTMANTNGFVFLKFPIDKQLLIFWNGFQDVQDRLVIIETWFYKITFENIFLLKKPDFRSTEFTFAFSHTKNFYCPILQQPKQIKRLRTCHKLEPIGNAQNPSSGFIQQNCSVEINTAPQHH